MATAAIHASATVSITLAMQVERQGGGAANKLVTFPGMDGAEILKGEASYPVFKISGWITASSLAGIETAATALEAQFKGLVGRDADTLILTYDDSATATTIKNVAGESAPQYGRPAKRLTAYVRPVSFAVRQVR